MPTKHPKPKKMSPPRKIKPHSSSSALKPVTVLRRSPRNLNAFSSPSKLLPPEALQSPPDEALESPGGEGSDLGVKLYDLQNGNKPYSMDQWIPTHVWEPESFEPQRQVLSSLLPITLKDTLLLPDGEICSMLEKSQSLPRPMIRSGSMGSVRKGRPHEGTVLVYGKCLHRRPGRDFDMSSSLGCSRLFHDCSYKFINDGALFILLVPSDEVINHLSFYYFTDRFPCVVVTAMASPEFLNQMVEELGIPVLALLSTDSKSLGMLASYGRRLKENFKWLGVRPTDMAKRLPPLPHTHPNHPDFNYNFFGIEPLRPPAVTKKDIKSAIALSKDDYINSRPEWAKEFRVMSRMKYKIEVERLVCVGALDYLVDWYLPMKLQTQDWI